MTPKEKAKLVEKFYQNAPDTFGTGKAFGHGQSCALIAVDVIMKTLWNAAAGGRVQIKNSDENLEYWEEVKEEIELL